MERRAESGIRPGGELQATDPHLMWVDLSGWRFSVCPSMYAAQGSGTSLSKPEEKDGIGSQDGIDYNFMEY